MKKFRLIIMVLLTMSLIVGPLQIGLSISNEKTVFAAESASNVRSKLKKCNADLAKYKKQLKSVKASIKSQTKNTTAIYGSLISRDPYILSQTTFGGTSYYWVENPSNMSTLFSTATGYVKKTGKTRIYSDGYYRYTCIVCKAVKVKGYSKKAKIEKKIETLQKKIKKYKRQLSNKLKIRNMTIYTGKTKRISRSWIYGNTGNKVTWKSSNPSVASVNSSGYVTGKKEGSVVITAITSISKKQSKATITVLNPVTSVEFRSENIELGISEEYDLSNDLILIPKDADYDSLEWETSDETVASVSGGKINANGFGTCKITVTINDTISASCNVVVGNIILGCNQFLYDPYGKGVQLYYQYYENNETSIKYTEGFWSTSDESLATIDSNGYLTVKGSGYVTITLVDNNGTKISRLVYVTNEEGEG